MNKNKMYIIPVSLIVVLSVFFTPAFSASLPGAKQDRGLIIFYRLSSFKGKAIRFNLNHAEGYIGQLLSGTFLYKYFEPGEHKFWSQVISQDSITVNVDAGQVYYIRGEVKMGVFAGRPQFTQMPASEALADIEKLK